MCKVKFFGVGKYIYFGQKGGGGGGILTISVVRRIFCETYEGSEMAVIVNMAEHFIDSRMNVPVFSVLS